MHFTKAFLALALVAAPIFAAPAATVEDGVSAAPLEARNTFVLCKPSKNTSGIKSFKVDIANAKAQGQSAGFKAGKSGDPHGYNSGDGIVWGVDNCDNKKNPLFEYPVFWDTAAQKEWKKGTKSKDQSKTPIRVVYANKNGGISYCGIMTHSEVDKTYQGKGFFEHCSSIPKILTSSYESPFSAPSSLSMLLREEDADKRATTPGRPDPPSVDPARRRERSIR
ncbi:hypothetical protein V500_03734 [Pseudogymnoascus sp. VKM F-4518 (FW-2643)]|nr:hypothetical protein V500_03734 [Pseudogymnoascus sp. VKM F-4518 (FW-2643)]